MKKLFISHASHDRELVDAFVQLLESGVGVPHGEIFCSSTTGQGIEPGERFVDSIRESLDEATCMIALLSPAYYQSAFCMCELGGTWLQAKKLIPILVPPQTYSSLKAVLAGMQVSRLDREEDLDEVRDLLFSTLGFSAHGTSRWNQRRGQFLAQLPKLLNATRFEGPVERSQYVELEETLNKEKEAFELQALELDAQRELNRRLSELKDPAEVAAVVAENAGFEDAFDALVDDVASALDGLHFATREALYYAERGEEYRPEREDWDEAQTAMEYGQIWEANEEGFKPDGGDSKVDRAVGVLSRLREWLEGPPDGFEDWYRSTHDGERAELSLRNFWDRHFT